MKYPVLYLALAALFVLAVALRGWCAPPPHKAWEEMIPMRDGVKLSTNIFVPEGKGRWPVILVRTPYGKDRSMRGKALPAKYVPPLDAKRADAIQRGYAMVEQDCRGRFRSEGKYRAFFDDPNDGYDTVEWLAKQPWCSSKIGMIGTSAPGITGKMAALAAPPHLTCVVAGQAFGSIYHYMSFQGGVYALMSDKWMKGQNGGDPFDLQGYLKDIFAHETYGPYWAGADMRVNCDKVQAPILQIGSWYDIFQQSTLEDFANIQSRGKGLARGNQRLVMNPGAHGALDGDLKYPNAAPPDGDIQDRWFDYWLKGVENGVMDGPAVRYYLMGDTMDPKAPGNKWVSSNVWPPAAKPTSFYFHADGKLSEKAPSDKKSAQTYEYDPKNPVPTIGGFNLQIKKGPMDQSPLRDRKGILRFETKPLEKPVAVVGKIDVEPSAGSDCPDTDWMVKLVDIYPNGYEALVTDGALRARFREGFDKRVFMKKGEVYRFAVDLWSTALVFNKGHRIAVHVTSSNFERYEPNSNTGKLVREDDETHVARNTVYHDREHASRIILPVVEKNLD